MPNVDAILRSIEVNHAITSGSLPTGQYPLMLCVLGSDCTARSGAFLRNSLDQVAANPIRSTGRREASRNGNPAIESGLTVTHGISR